MEKYYIIKPNKTIEYVGEYASSIDAYDHVVYELDLNYTWIISLSELTLFKTHLDDIITR